MGVVGGRKYESRRVRKDDRHRERQGNIDQGDHPAGHGPQKNGTEGWGQKKKLKKPNTRPRHYGRKKNQTYSDPKRDKSIGVEKKEKGGRKRKLECERATTSRGIFGQKIRGGEQDHNIGVKKVDWVG